MNFNTIPEALEDLRQGKIILVTDDPDRENEGDFICAAEFATTENINFMATHGKGLICMPMSEAFVRKLQFPQMVQNNTDNHETAFTVSIDHISTSTGISAAERSVTAMACVEEGAKAEDFRRPGHMFPLLSKKNGVLEREGHTEATVDLCRLAGLKECGLCCEIMREDGTMMRTAELMTLAERFGIKFITIRDLQAYRKCHEKLVDQVTAVNMPTKYGDFKAYGFVSRLNGEHHVALVKGDIGDGKDILCRVHSECLTGDTFGSLRCDCGQQLVAAMTQIENEGRGILLYMRQEGRGIGLINKLKAYELQEQGFEVDLVDIDRNGKIDLEHLRELLRRDTILVSVCLVDSELGTIQPVSEIAEILRDFPGCRLHVDATQAMGKIPVCLDGIDTLSFTPHKFYGLNGSGILYKKKDLILEPLIHGGHSTTIYRSGTPALSLAAAAKCALSDAISHQKERYETVSGYNRFLREELSKIPGVSINSPEDAVPHILNVSVKGIRGTRMQQALNEKGICVSVKSACAVEGTPSKAVYAVCRDRNRAMNSFRISLSHLTTKKELDTFLQVFLECCKERE